MKNKKHSISVVMATYNGESYIEQQLDSIVNQTLKPTEIVIVDDCSTDNTVSFINKYLNKTLLTDIKLTRNKKNLGINKTFQEAFIKATGDIIFISDQDDIWVHNKIETMFYEWNKEDLICSNASMIDSNGKIVHESEFDFFKMNEERANKNPLYFTFSNSISGHNMAISKELLNKVLPFPENIMYDQWMAIAAHSRRSLKIVDSILCLHRLHNSNSQNKNLDKGSKNKHVHSKSIAEKKLKIFNYHQYLNTAMRNIDDKADTRFTSLVKEFEKHYTCLGSTIFNFPLFISLVRLRKILFPNTKGWRRIKLIRNLSIGEKGFWIKI